MNKLDEFYPVSNAMTNFAEGMWQVGMIVKLADHLANAKKGNKESESKLCNRLGQLRRNVKFEGLTEDLRLAIKEASDWLRSTGRSVDFRHTNPGMWITARDGRTPRF